MNLYSSESYFNQILYRNLQISACFQASDLTGCDFISKDVNIKTITKDRRYITTVVFPYDSSLESNSTFKNKKGEVIEKFFISSNVCSVTVHNGPYGAKLDQIELTFQKYKVGTYS